MLLLLIILSVVAGYLLGSLNASLIVGKVFYKCQDYGSGNAGATNMLRTFGKVLLPQFCSGLFKGILACGVGHLLVGYIPDLGWAGMYLAGFAAVIGHNWPSISVLKAVRVF